MAAYRCKECRCWVTLSDADLKAGKRVPQCCGIQLVPAGDCPNCFGTNVNDRTIGGSAVPLAKSAAAGGHPIVAAVLGAMQVAKVATNLLRHKYECRDCAHTFNK
jgi:hypothetical protein